MFEKKQAKQFHVCQTVLTLSFIVDVTKEMRTYVFLLWTTGNKVPKQTI